MNLLISWEYPESAITASIFELQNNEGGKGYFRQP